jgi:hypothetical protein
MTQFSVKPVQPWMREAAKAVLTLRARVNVARLHGEGLDDDGLREEAAKTIASHAPALHPSVEAAVRKAAEGIAAYVQSVGRYPLMTRIEEHITAELAAVAPTEGSLLQPPPGHFVDATSAGNTAVEAPEREAAAATQAELEAQIEALDAKIKALALHGTCGCSYDAPDDVCLHHSPKLVAAAARIAALETLLQGGIDLVSFVRSRREEETWRDKARAALARKEPA